MIASSSPIAILLPYRKRGDIGKYYEYKGNHINNLRYIRGHQFSWIQDKTHVRGIMNSWFYIPVVQCQWQFSYLLGSKFRGLTDPRNLRKLAPHED